MTHPAGDPSVVWTAPVRFAEVDAQQVVFNAHYLTWCDEAMAAFTAARLGADGRAFADRVRLVTTRLEWTASARLGDQVEVAAHCDRIGRTSLTMVFDVRAGGRDCCRVETVYVALGDDDRPAPVTDPVRAGLLD